MSIFTRSDANPLLSPDPLSSWESYATFNPTVIKDNQTYHLFYRAMSEEKTYLKKKLRLSSIGHSTSSDGISFQNRTQFIVPDREWDMYGCEDPRITKINDNYFIFYTALGGFPPHKNNIKCAVALSKDLKTVYEKHLVTPFNAKGMALFPEKINRQFTVILTVDTDNPPAKIAIAQFEHLDSLWDPNFWIAWYENVDEYTLPLRRVTTDQVEIGAPPLYSPQGWILIHSYIKNYFYPQKQFRVEAVLLDLNDPQKIMGRIEDPCLIPEVSYELKGQIENIVFPEGALIDGDGLKMYYGAADNTCCLATAMHDDFIKKFEINTPSPITCTRFTNNPLLEPIKAHNWEDKAVFNPAAIEIDNRVYLLYRTTSKSDVSSIGCAISYDGICIDERLPKPVFTPQSIWDTSTSPAQGGYGCEDPRITRIDETIYMCYTAFDGKLPRLALTSITVPDFLNHNWKTWKDPIIISPPGVVDKDGCLFPEKINGKYAFFHRIEPNIVIDFVDDLSFLKKKFLENNIVIKPRSKTWDDIKIGINAPPFKTNVGWLVFYHGISRIDNHYRLGAMLLDLKDVSQVLARTNYPILEPEMTYECQGVVNNVVFPCGFVQKKEEIFLYYGGADKVVCGAKINTQKLLYYLLKSEVKKYLL